MPMCSTCHRSCSRPHPQAPLFLRSDAARLADHHRYTCTPRACCSVGEDQSRPKANAVCSAIRRRHPIIIVHQWRRRRRHSRCSAPNVVRCSSTSSSSSSPSSSCRRRRRRLRRLRRPWLLVLRISDAEGIPAFTLRPVLGQHPSQLPHPSLSLRFLGGHISHYREQEPAEVDCTRRLASRHRCRPSPSRQRRSARWGSITDGGWRSRGDPGRAQAQGMTQRRRGLGSAREHRHRRPALLGVVGAPLQSCHGSGDEVHRQALHVCSSAAPAG